MSRIWNMDERIAELQRCSGSSSSACSSFHANSVLFPVSSLAERNPTDLFLGPCFEGAHPPTFGPRSAGGSLDGSEPDETYAHHDVTSVDCISAEGSRPSSSGFSRANSATLLEIDSILRDVGCGCDAQRPTGCLECCLQMRPFF